jgi:hypothetical protein
MGKKSLKRTSEALTEKPTTSPTPTPTTTTKTKKIKSSNTTTATSSKKREEEEEDEILSSKVPFIKRSQVEQAIKALIDYSNKSVEKNIEQGELFADQVGSNERFLNLVISLKRITPKPKHKPIKM